MKKKNKTYSFTVKPKELSDAFKEFVSKGDMQLVGEVFRCANQKIAVVVPTIRLESLKQFLAAWEPLFRRHSVDLYTVFDGEKVRVEGHCYSCSHEVQPHGDPFTPEDLLGKRARKAIFNLNDGVRNIGFIAAKKFSNPSVIITLDDDVMPDGNDPIQEHLDALKMKVPISWFSTANAPGGGPRYMRGFPYGVRDEADVWVSHGVWTGVHDYDGPTQLVNGNKPATFYKGPIPKGCLTPVCGMNLAFRIEALPWMYFAPMGKKLGVQRFGDIWMGIYLKRKLDELGKAMVSGYSTIRHVRASNVLANLAAEATGIGINEELWEDSTPFDAPANTKYKALYEKAQQEWYAILSKL